MRVLLGYPALIAVIALVGCARESGRLRIDAAASLREVVTELAELHAVRTGGAAPLVNLAGSGELARQIEKARKTDVFLSAGVREMDQLDARGIVVRETRRELCSNALVVVARDAHPDFVIDDLARARHVSIAHPEVVPAGRYAAAWLRERGLADQVLAHATRSPSVRAALAAVQSGACEYGFVYASDLHVAPGLHVVHQVDASELPPIVYPGAVLEGARNPDEARAFLELCVSPEGRAIFARHGFLPAGGA